MTLKNENFGIATKAIIFHKGKYLILLKSKIEKINPDTYDIPGGRLELGEGLTKSLVREVKEETNLNIVPLQTINSWIYKVNNKFHLIGIDYLCNLKSGRLVLSEEHSEAYWLEPKEIFSSGKIPKWIKKTIKIAEVQKKLFFNK